jgi:CBS domain-containing protein
MQTVGDIMTADPVTLDVDTTLREAIDALQAAGVSGAPVLSGDQLVGVVSGTDFLDFEASSPGVPPERREMLEWGEIDTPSEEDAEEYPAAFFVDRWIDSESEVFTRISETESPEWDRLDEHTVGEVMSRRLVTVDSGAPVSEAARRMLDSGVHRVLVVEERGLVGIVSAFDILRVVANPSEAS